MAAWYLVITCVLFWAVLRLLITILTKKRKRIAVISLLTPSSRSCQQSCPDVLFSSLSHYIVRSLITASERHAYAPWQSYKLRKTKKRRMMEVALKAVASSASICRLQWCPLSGGSRAGCPGVCSGQHCWTSWQWTVSCWCCCESQSWWALFVKKTARNEMRHLHRVGGTNTVSSYKVNDDNFSRQSATRFGRQENGQPQGPSFALICSWNIWQS